MLGFGSALRRVASDEGLTPRLVSDRPEEWRLGPLTVAVAGDRAQLKYARVAVARAAATPEAVMTAWRRTLDSLAARSLAPDDFLPLLAAGYDAVLAGRPAGDRVDLAQVRAEVARRHRGHTRAQFAWDLARLRRERRLILGDRRIDLGVATGDAARLRSRVVWIEDESGAGQYYLTFRTLKEVRG